MDSTVINDDGLLTIFRTDAKPGGFDTKAEAEQVATYYEYRIFLPRCETYAIRFGESDITGVYGPLEYDEVIFSALPSFPYKEQTEDIAWAKLNLSEFVPCFSEHEEGTIRI